MLLKVKNWEKFQHYQNGRGTPPWIKLYRDLLNDIEWFKLDGDTAKFLVNCWILAAENHGELPDSETLAFRLRIDSKVLAKHLSACQHWIISDASAVLADCYQVATPETETETETDKETEKEIKKKAPAVAMPDGVSDSVWSDFKKLRTAKKAPITATSIAGIEREARKAGYTLEQALATCCERGWSGFKADWVANQGQRGVQSFAEREREIARKRWEEMTGEIHPDNLHASIVQLVPDEPVRRIAR